MDRFNSLEREVVVGAGGGGPADGMSPEAGDVAPGPISGAQFSIMVGVGWLGL